MEGLPILDYAPSTLLGIGVLLIFLGLLVPYRVVKSKDEEIAFLRSTNAKQAEALETALSTNKVTEHFFESLTRGGGL